MIQKYVIMKIPCKGDPLGDKDLRQAYIRADFVVGNGGEVIKSHEDDENIVDNLAKDLPMFTLMREVKDSDIVKKVLECVPEKSIWQKFLGKFV